MTIRTNTLQDKEAGHLFLHSFGQRSMINTPAFDGVVNIDLKAVLGARLKERTELPVFCVRKKIRHVSLRILSTLPASIIWAVNIFLGRTISKKGPLKMQPTFYTCRYLSA